MADTKIVIAGIDGLEGEYDIDLGFFTNRELHTIKRLTGLRVGEFDDAMAAGDSDVLVAFCMVALQRNDKRVDENALWDAEAGSITIIVGDDQEPPLESVPLESSGDSPTSSGDDSTSVSALRENDLDPIGTQA
jgi:hypothetical protein